MNLATMSDEMSAKNLLPSIVRTLAIRYYIDSIGRNDLYQVSDSWWLDEIKSDETIAKVRFADELKNALANPKIETILLTLPNHITRPQLHNLLKACSIRHTILLEV